MTRHVSKVGPDARVGVQTEQPDVLHHCTLLRNDNPLSEVRDCGRVGPRLTRKVAVVLDLRRDLTNKRPERRAETTRLFHNQRLKVDAQRLQRTVGIPFHLLVRYSSCETNSTNELKV